MIYILTAATLANRTPGGKLEAADAAELGADQFLQGSIIGRA